MMAMPRMLKCLTEVPADLDIVSMRRLWQECNYPGLSIQWFSRSVGYGEPRV